MNLTQDDVLEIVRLLDTSPFDELRLDTGRFKLVLRRSEAGVWSEETQTPSETGTAPVPQAEKREPLRLEPGTKAILAPLMGTFYRAPKPGAQPFVEVGSEVDEHSVVAIVETMKLMNSVPAGVKGKIIAICAENGEFVDQERVLMVVRP